MDMVGYIIAEADGKCFMCGNYCMECGCWCKGLDFSYLENNQPERLNPETHDA